MLLSIQSIETGPSNADLAEAPTLRRWKAAISPRGHLTLWGEVIDHPRLGSTNITTSQLIAIDVEAGWARTASRWYRLGQSMAEIERALAKSLDIKNAAGRSIDIRIPGFANVDDPALLAELLATYIARVYEIDAADRARQDEEVR